MRSGFVARVLGALTMTVVLGFVGTACVAPTKVVRMDSRIDSLETANLALLVERNKLADSLAMIEYQSSGEMDRDLRRFRYEIDRLTYDLQSCREGGDLVARLLVDDLFEPASARLTSVGMARVDSVVATFLTDDRRQIAVVGHADNSKPGATLAQTYPSNWELSGARASAIVRHMIERAGIDPRIVSAISHGDSHPEYSNGTTEGRRRNRRIEFLRM